MRSLLFTIWLKAGKDIVQTIALVEQMVLSQFEIVSRGGSRMVQASVNGQTFQYELPDGWDASQFTETLREIYKQITTLGASGQMTDDELQDFVLDSGNQVTNVAKARFANDAGGRY